ncbi:hypothetical protein C731_4510 [Mycolicibacterium hassiacum DSM 44199]|uniref:Uncharacterized protein n=1 Tax=Mycolicibacterium hassiacum (strain DSM 44199 / CIP 105218 / JCM 12690 / 3849) TaxID=1122247 RepID=K5B786_MYCHD|nr:hypothetical protein C731_4510 [Mycolicibacterium hassiacum DSM 44199]
MWLSLAARHGVGNALAALESVVREMSAEEKHAGAERLREFGLVA